MATPRLIVAGNCQANFLSKLLAAHPHVRDRYHVVYHRHLRPGARPVLSEKHLRNCDILIEQIAHGFPELSEKTLLPKWAKVFRFPILWLNSLWPSYTRDARNPPKGVEKQIWPYGDRIILEGLDQGLTPNAAVQRWFETDLVSALNLDRFHEINEAKALALDARAEVKLSRYVLDNFRRERLFASHNHPYFPLFEVLRDRVYEALDLPPDGKEMREAARDQYDTHVPIHPTVARHFGLEWWTPEMAGKLRNLDVTPFEYWRKYAAFETP